MAAAQRKVAVALFHRKAAPAEEPAPEPAATGKGKNRPTPSRREAEAARRQRLTRTMSRREARLEASRQNRAARMKALHAREAIPEKILMRDYVDARFSLGELLLPSLVVILALSFLSPIWPQITLISTAAMYLFILLVILDLTIMWRGFKKVLAERLPNAPTRGLMMYGMNRSIQIRRFRLPAPRIKRGEPY